ncbi:MAG: hypothetical protein HY701_10755 [Gemmatimonadetes bacterium]|nr:hypothetical protein [Gemmatimonadota bacterium]
MAKKSDKVMAMVERELKADPKVSVADLMAKAKKLDSSVARLSTRQFHAIYPLQIKRRRARRTRRGRAAGARAAAGRRGRIGRRVGAALGRRGRRAVAAAGVDREAIRSVFIGFAKDVTQAEGKTEILDLIGTVDARVDQVIRLAAS